MAKYVSLENLELYDEKIKAKMAADDASMLASAQADAKTKADAVQGKLDEEVTRAKAREDEIAGLVATAQGEVDALEGKVGEVPADKTVMGIITEIQQSAYDDTEVRGLISGLDTNKADKTQVAQDIETAVNAEKTAREQAVAGVQGEVDALEQTHATDKAELEGKISTAQGTANTAKAAIDAFLKEADASADAIDTLKEIQAELDAGEASAASMLADINALKEVDNATQAEMDAALVVVNENIGKKADQTTVDGIDGRVKALEEVDVATKAYVDQAETDAVDAAKGYADGLNTAMDTKVNGVSGRVETLETAMPNKADKATTLAGYGIGDAYTKTETDTAISNAMTSITPVDNADIEALFA